MKSVNYELLLTTPQTREQLHRWTHRQKTPVGLAKRARVMLMLEQGFTFVRTAKSLELTECNLRIWAKRFLEQGTAGKVLETSLRSPAHVSSRSCSACGQVGL